VKESTIGAARLAGTEQRRRWAGQNEVAYGRPLARWIGPSGAEPRAAIWAATFDLMRIAVLILDAAGYCIDTNEAADRLLAATRLIRIRRGIVVIDDKDARRLVANAVRAAAAGAGAPATVVALTLEGKRHFAAQLSPLCREGLRPSDGIAALLLQEIGNLRPLSGEFLVKLYGFTRTEARLVTLLARDFSLEDAGAALGIARSTAKTHLQHVFAKTGTNRQPQVVRLALSAIATPAA
jgi:DNA-binding CsgD family transcriptional regulator